MDLKDSLRKIASMYVAKLKSNIASDGTVASKELINSIDYEVTENGFDILSERYLGTVSEGKKPTSKNPSPEMVSSIASWMRYKRIPIRGYRGRFRKQTPLNYRKAAFGIAKKINTLATYKTYIQPNMYKTAACGVYFFTLPWVFAWVRIKTKQTPSLVLLLYDFACFDINLR